MTWYNDTNVQAAIAQFLTWHPGSIVADINRHFETIELDAPSLRHLYRVVDRMVESGTLRHDASGLYVKHPTEVPSDGRNERENLDLKAILTGYVLAYPGISAIGIVRKVRELNIPNLPNLPSADVLYQMIDDIADDYA